MRAAVALQNLRLENEVMQLQRELELLNSVEHQQVRLEGSERSEQPNATICYKLTPPNRRFAPCPALNFAHRSPT